MRLWFKYELCIWFYFFPYNIRRCHKKRIQISKSDEKIKRESLKCNEKSIVLCDIVRWIGLKINEISIEHVNNFQKKYTNNDFWMKFFYFSGYTKSMIIVNPHNNRSSVDSYYHFDGISNKKKRWKFVEPLKWWDENYSEL